MKKHRCIFALAIALILCSSAAPTAHAQDLEAPTSTDYLHLSLGKYDFRDNTDQALELRAEYRPAYKLFNLDNAHPWVGLELTSEASIWMGGGALYNFNLTPDWTITPSLGAGFYAQGSSELDLGSPIIFRTQIEASYRYDNDAKMTLSLAHHSNAGLDGDNPGAEVLSLGVGFPF